MLSTVRAYHDAQGKRRNTDRYIDYKTWYKEFVEKDPEWIAKDKEA